MTMIANPKVSGFVPVWAPFKGFSLLFDNPGDNYSKVNGYPELEKIDCRSGSPELAFYQTLWDVSREAGELACSYLFCALPLHSYHVTVWDGLNDFNVRRLPDRARLEAEQWLRSLPASFDSRHPLLTVPDGEPIGIRIEPIEFEYDCLEKWNNSSIVARLKPTDSHAEVVLSGIEKARERLNGVFEQRFGFPTAVPQYRPHVSIGYLANKQLGEKAEEAVQRLHAQLAPAISGRRLRFATIGMYGMSDMETFFRRVECYEGR
ncbi:hypothetical protein [Paenibacillus sp. GCM10012303]|uniref:hypothetical protein n=1 Tax=Paenibacillus sp. GCM10012303 TaxID=3317340 RepID=UPI0036D2C502